MGNVIDLASRMRQLPPSWGASVSIDPDGAELTGFWGEDGMETSERCAVFALHLEALAARLRLLAAATHEEPKP